jgi:hypothetical protein
MNIPFNETTINVTIEWIRNLTNYAQEFSGISVASTSVVGFIGLYLILSFFPSLIANYFLSRRLVCDNNDVKNDLCINVLNLFFWVHFFRWFLLYMVTFSLIIYFSLIFLITSNEYLSLVLIIVTTFLVIIAEFFVSREDMASRENIARGPFVGPLVASIVAASFFALMVFMIANVFLPSTCFTLIYNIYNNANIGSLMNSIASSYALLLILAAIFGAIPYASTLWAIQYHYECSCPPAEKRGEQRSGAGGSRPPERKPGIRSINDDFHDVIPR